MAAPEDGPVAESSQEIRAVELSIYGRVQGVWFRDSARRRAEELGLSGHVRNDPDGSVFLHAEGEPTELDRLIEWCHEGSPLAEVERVVQKQSVPKGQKGFRIVY